MLKIMKFLKNFPRKLENFVFTTPEPNLIYNYIFHLFLTNIKDYLELVCKDF